VVGVWGGREVGGGGGLGGGGGGGGFPNLKFLLRQTSLVLN